VIELFEADGLDVGEDVVALLDAFVAAEFDEQVADVELLEGE
jgi:hypothetical protein